MQGIMTDGGVNVLMTDWGLMDIQCYNASRYIFPTYIVLIYPFFHIFAAAIRPYIIL